MQAAIYARVSTSAKPRRRALTSKPAVWDQVSPAQRDAVEPEETRDLAYPRRAPEATSRAYCAATVRTPVPRSARAGW
jgi:hypothetical protein